MENDIDRQEIELEPLHAFEKLALEVNGNALKTIIRHRHTPADRLSVDDQAAFRNGYEELLRRDTEIRREIALRRNVQLLDIHIHAGRVWYRPVLQS